MEHRSLSPQTLAAQALGETDPVSGALAPVITMSTNYEQRPDGSYPQGRAYTRADNPTSEHAERLLALLESGERGRVCSGGGARGDPAGRDPAAVAGAPGDPDGGDHCPGRGLRAGARGRGPGGGGQHG